MYALQGILFHLKPTSLVREISLIPFWITINQHALDYCFIVGEGSPCKGFSAIFVTLYAMQSKLYLHVLSNTSFYVTCSHLHNHFFSFVDRPTAVHLNSPWKDWGYYVQLNMHMKALDNAILTFHNCYPIIMNIVYNFTALNVTFNMNNGM